MTDSQKLIKLRKLKKSLKHGDQRRIAIRLGAHPAKVSDAFYGLVADEDFLDCLEAETEKFLEEKDKYSDSE